MFVFKDWNFSWIGREVRSTTAFRILAKNVLKKNVFYIDSYFQKVAHIRGSTHFTIILLKENPVVRFLFSLNVDGQVI